MRNGGGGGGYGRNGSHYHNMGNGYGNSNGASTSSSGPGLMGDMPSGSGLSGSTLSLTIGPGPHGLNSDSPSRKRRRISGRPSQSPPAIWEPRRSQRVMVSTQLKILRRFNGISGEIIYRCNRAVRRCAGRDYAMWLRPHSSSSNTINMHHSNITRSSSNNSSPLRRPTIMQCIITSRSRTMRRSNNNNKRHIPIPTRIAHHGNWLAIPMAVAHRPAAQSVPYCNRCRHRRRDRLLLLAPLHRRPPR